jgi:hypothetical protein
VRYEQRADLVRSSRKNVIGFRFAEKYESGPAFGAYMRGKRDASFGDGGRSKKP